VQELHLPDTRERGRVMKYIVCGSYENPKKAKSYARFSSKLDYQTQEEAQILAETWKIERDYLYVWIEEAK
jgi:hypothetical protein